MAQIKNAQYELHRFRTRLAVSLGFVLFCFLLLVLRFFWLQAVEHKALALRAQNNRTTIVPIVLRRGLIYDRSGVLLASNYPTYMLEITPSKVDGKLDEVIDELSKVVQITTEDKRRFNRSLGESSRFDSVPIRTRLTETEIARFTAQSFRFPGVQIKARLLREYPQGDVASHLLGYVGRINVQDAKWLEDNDLTDEYQGTEYIGKNGVEKRYEQELHGKTGFELMEIAASGKAVRVLSRQPAEPGDNLVLTIDADLQKVIEEAFGNRRGALVAIEPSTGKVLAYVSMPNFNPNLFVDGIDQQNWDLLNNSPDHPLLNRILRGTFAPGSTYKPYMALAALQLGYRTPQYRFLDPGFFVLGNHRFRDDKPGGHGWMDLYKSIVVSCDTFYYMLANDMGVDTIHDFMRQFSFGEKTGIDLNGEKTGVLPSIEWKRKTFRSAATRKWYAGETVSLGIGQGYNSFTPLQMAQAMSILANDGHVMQPHVVDAIVDAQDGSREAIAPKELYTIPIEQKYWDLVKNAMVDVTTEGTAASAFRNAGYVSAGKTGTAQVVDLRGQKYNAKTLKERHRDNGLYIGFAPADHPRIALAVIVENEGWGATTAAPIARIAFDYYLLGKANGGKPAQNIAVPQEDGEDTSPPQSGAAGAAADQVPLDPPQEKESQDE